jgi:two-component system, LytTR family, response regulator
MVKVVIVEDEIQAKNALETMLLDYNIKIYGHATGVNEAYELITTIQPDVVFLDIELVDGSSFDLLDKFSNIDFKVIFVTGHDNFALKAFRYNAIDYLMKPIDQLELKSAIDRIKLPVKNESLDFQVRQLLSSMKKKSLDRLLIHTAEGISVIPQNQIIRLESDANYTTIYTSTSQKHIASINLKNYEEMLPEPPFFRIHQSHIINIDFITKVLKEDGGFVVLENGIKIPIARRRKDEFLELLKSNF